MELGAQIGVRIRERDERKKSEGHTDPKVIACGNININGCRWFVGDSKEWTSVLFLTSKIVDSILNTLCNGHFLVHTINS